MHKHPPCFCFLASPTLTMAHLRVMLNMYWTPLAERVSHALLSVWCIEVRLSSYIVDLLDWVGRFRFSSVVENFSAAERNPEIKKLIVQLIESREVASSIVREFTEASLFIMSRC